MTTERWVAAAAATVLLGALVLVVFRRRQEHARAVEPATVFLFAWGCSLALFAIPLVRYTTTSTAQWLIVYGAVITFLLGAWLAQRCASKDGGTGPSEHLDADRVHIVWLLTGALALVGFALFVRAIDGVVGWQTLLEDLDAARAAQTDPRFIGAYGVGRALSYLAAVSLLLWSVALREGFFRGRLWTLAPLEALVLVPYFFTGERQSLLVALVLIFAFHLLWRPVKRPGRMAAIAFVLLIAGGAYFYAVAIQKQATIGRFPEIEKRVTVKGLEQLALPYLYATANFPVFGELTEDQIAPRTYGQLTVLPATKAAYALLPLEGTVPLANAFYTIPFENYNSATWLNPFYRDFGVAGALLLPGIVGFLTTWAVYVARRRGTLLATWLASIGLSIVAFSPLKSQLSDLIVWELLIVVPAVALFVAEGSAVDLHRTYARSVGRLSSTVKGVALLAILLLGAGGVASAYLVEPGPQQAPSSGTREDLAARLDRDARKVMAVFRRDGPSSGFAVASQLQQSDPSAAYERLPDNDELPSSRGTVGLFADNRGFILRSVARDGQIVEVRRSPP